MITIQHEASQQVALVGTRESFAQIGNMIRKVSQNTGASLRCVAKATEFGSNAQVPALLRVKVTEDPIILLTIGKDLIVKGNTEGLISFCTALEFPESCQSGETHIFEALLDNPQAVLVSIVLDQRQGD